MGCFSVRFPATDRCHRDCTTNRDGSALCNLLRTRELLPQQIDLERISILHADVNSIDVVAIVKLYRL